MSLPPGMEMHASLGAQVIPWVGSASSVQRFDPFASEGVRLAQSAFELNFDKDHFTAELRVEEGIFHAGALEAGEAMLGVEGAWGGAWLGRGDLMLTRDRWREPEELGFSLRPSFSRTALPMHAGGAAGWVGAPGLATLNGGAAWLTPNADAPLFWGRLQLGDPPELEMSRVEGLSANLGLGAAFSDSPTLGRTTLAAVDGELRYGPGCLAADLLWSPERMSVGASGGLTLERGRALVRAERLSGLEEAEAARWLGSARLGATPRPDVEIYLEGQVSREIAAPDPDRVVLSIERPNGYVAVGMRMDLP